MSDTPTTSPDGTDITLVNESHIKAYQETNGETGHMWNGATALLFTHTGAKSGQKRTTAIIYTQVGDRYAIIASMGGAPKHPAWFHNVVANPDVEVQIKGDKFAATARVADSAERAELWAEAIKQWPNFDVYQSRTERVIPAVVLERK
jgi:deazaflavin-dependent oxidoreductase (nitroreductase family)